MGEIKLNFDVKKVNEDNICARCGKHRGQHQAETQGCPEGPRTRIGFIQYSDVYRFCRPQPVLPIARKGKRQIWQAKVGTGPSTNVFLKRNSQTLHWIGERISYCETQDVEGISSRVTPPWQSGIVRDIRDGRLFIEKM